MEIQYTFDAPALINASLHEAIVAPVVTTSSTRRTDLPSMIDFSAVNAPLTLACL